MNCIDALCRPLRCLLGTLCLVLLLPLAGSAQAEWVELGDMLISWEGPGEVIERHGGLLIRVDGELRIDQLPEERRDFSFIELSAGALELRAPTAGGAIMSVGGSVTIAQLPPLFPVWALDTLAAPVFDIGTTVSLTVSFDRSQTVLRSASSSSTSVPEPGTASLLALGLCSLAARRRFVSGRRTH